MSEAVHIEAPAKVNLRLHVLAQETTGYHALETVFCAVSLSDTLRVRRDGGAIDLDVRGGIDVGEPRDNLVVRAARSFYLRLGGVQEGTRIELEKRIPAAAGLGGGSSDAAATLRALNHLYDQPLSPGELLQIAIELGSDVPFFLCGSPLALGWSRGERLLALPPLPSRPVLIAHPGVGMPTGAAFQRIAELRGGGYRPRAFAMPLQSLLDWDSVATLAENHFEAAADEQIPGLVAARRAMTHAGASLALLSGSGASLFGVFPDVAGRDAAAQGLAEQGFATWAAQTLDRMPEPRAAAG